MYILSNKLLVTVLITICSIFITPIYPAASNCLERAEVTSNTDLWSCPPEYITGRGWKYGNSIGNLPPGTQVYICSRITVGFGGATQQWYQIAYRWNNAWQYAWVFADSIQILSQNKKIDLFDGFFSVNEAYAAEISPMYPSNTTLTNSYALPQNELPPPPPSPSTSSGLDSNLISTNTLYIYIFLAMIIGMVAKVLFDIIEAWDKKKIKQHIQRGLIALVVSPIVFLMLIQSAEFGMKGQKSFIILLLFAFQNGFFWQTIVKPGKDSPQVAK